MDNWLGMVDDREIEVEDDEVDSGWWYRGRKADI